jgi:hypothetical protein
VMTESRFRAVVEMQYPRLLNYTSRKLGKTTPAEPEECIADAIADVLNDRSFERCDSDEGAYRFIVRAVKHRILRAWDDRDTRLERYAPLPDDESEEARARGNRPQAIQGHAEQARREDDLIVGIDLRRALRAEGVRDDVRYMLAGREVGWTWDSVRADYIRRFGERRGRQRHESLRWRTETARRHLQKRLRDYWNHFSTAKRSGSTAIPVRGVEPAAQNF